MSLFRLVLSVTLLVLLPISEASAQRSYSGNTLGCVPGVPDVNSQDLNADRGLGVCDEKNVHSLQFEPGSQDLGSIDFFIRSCWSWYYTNPCQIDRYGRYSVEVDGPTENGYLYLTGSSGDTLKVTLEFVHPARPAETLTPGQETDTLYPGVRDYLAGPVSLRVSLAPGESLVSDSYSGNFDLYVYQCEWWDYQPLCKNAPGDDGAPALLAQPVRFQVGLNPDTLIKISGLEDMELDGSGTGDISAEQTFCVFTTDSAEFNIRGDSQNGDNAFWLRGETITDDIIPYSVQVEHLGSARRPRNLREGEVARKWPGANQENCGGQENMKIQIEVQRSEMGDPRDARYQDILTLTVATE
ncbi:hypothetical protein [Microbulbifer sp.]|uniref:hypothetical protein n=1 Tax=Microbulbifer sp. TaxID=1908541 RepID=UPI00258A4472|nr:hypothetical protein [Microbulbifer sp.]